MMLNFKCEKLPSDSLALSNKVLVHPNDFKTLTSKASDPSFNFIKLENYIFTYE